MKLIVGRRDFLGRAIAVGLFTVLSGASVFAFEAAGGFKAAKPVLVIVPLPPGAVGSIGAEFVGRSPADGYTSNMANADTHSIYPNVNANADKNFVAADFRCVTPVARMGFVLFGRQNLEAKNLSELPSLAYRRLLTYSSWGVGNSLNLSMVGFVQATKIPEFLHVPYQGARPAAQALVGGQVDLMMMLLPIAKAQGERIIRYGVLAEERSHQFPDLPTTRELKVDLLTEAWIGILAPPQTPQPIVEALSKAFIAAMSTPEVRKPIEDAGLTPSLQDASGIQEYLAQENRKWG